MIETDFIFLFFSAFGSSLIDRQHETVEPSWRFLTVVNICA